jgi:hypothetical protein
LEVQGIRYWYSKKHLRGAQQWHDEIGEALDRCDWFLVVLSPAAIRSEWVKREFVYALNERRFKGRILPVLLSPCKANRLSWTLGEFQSVDFTEDFDEGCRNLLKIWGRNYQPPGRKAKRKTKPQRHRRNPNRRRS